MIFVDKKFKDFFVANLVCDYSRHAIIPRKIKCVPYTIASDGRHSDHSIIP